MTKIRYGPDGIHIFDRSTGSNLLIDEIIPDESHWTSSPRQVSIALTNSCDLNCTHCYASKSPAVLNPGSIKKWMKELDHSGSHGVGFGGGEPFLYPHIIELCEFGKNETNLAITLTTHGHLLSKSLIRSLQGNVNFIRISMDGVNSNYEAIRGRSFESLIEKIKLLSGEIPFGINMVVNHITISDINRVAEVAESYNASELLFLPEVAVGRGNQVNEDSLLELTTWIGNYSGPLQLSISSNYKSIISSDCVLEKEPSYVSFSHVDANGVLKSCSFEDEGVLINDKGLLYAFNQLIEMRGYK